MILPEIMSWIMTAQFFELIKLAKQKILCNGNFFANEVQTFGYNIVFSKIKIYYQGIFAVA